MHALALWADQDERSDGLVGRVEWLHADLDVWTPSPGCFDLVTAHYVHACGTLLVVGNLTTEGAGHGHRHQAQNPHRRDPDLFYTADAVAAVLDPGEWCDAVTATRDRDPGAAARTGNPVPDTVLVARRSGAR